MKDTIYLLILILSFLIVGCQIPEDPNKIEVKAGHIHHNDITFETDTQIIYFNEKGQLSDFLPIEMCIEDQLLDKLINWGNL